MLNAESFFLCNHARFEFGAAQGFGKGADVDEEPPDSSARTTDSLATDGKPQEGEMGSVWALQTARILLK